MKVLVEVHGCTLNRGESEEFIEAIVKNGHEIISTESEADAFVLFTCGVIETTEKHMLKRIAQLSVDPSKPLLVCGCLVNINPEAIMKTAPHAHLFGPSQQMEASKYFMKSGRPGIRFHDPQPKIGILPVSTGCLGNCSYCITKVARGHLQSRPVKEIKQRLEMLIARNCVEIQICAEDTAIYGQDIDSNPGILIKELETVDGDFMMRIGMMNPANAKRKLDHILGAYDSRKVFKFLHIPVQSGSDSVLGNMNRNYTSQDFIDVADTFRARFPGLALSTDIIVGFPGETDNDFQASVNLIKKIRPDIINITRFSSRPGTKAATMGNRVPGWAAKERSREMTKLRFRITGQSYENIIGQKIRALATESQVRGTTFLRTRNYRPIVVDSVMELGKWYDVEIIGARAAYLNGKLAQNE